MQLTPATETSEFLRHESCPACGSRNNLARYDDGHGFCFGCSYWEPGDGSDYTPSQQSRMTFTLKGSPEPLPKRRISEEVCKKYRVNRDGSRLYFHYFNSDGICTGAKVKTTDKQFTWDGNNSDHSLFGQHLFPSSGKRVVITEGELDALSCQEAMPGWPMVSIPDGAASAKRSIQRQLEWLQGYQEIVLFFDNDDAGRQAAKDAASILPPGKCTIARLDGWKDASDALQEGAAQAIREAIWNATPYRPDGIVDAKSLLEVITTPNPPCAHEYPYVGLQSKLHGIRYGELVTITAGSGIGKSSFCRELATHLLNSGERVGYLALEESNRRTALGLMSCAEGKAFHMGEHSREDLTDAYTKTIKDWNLYLFDGFGSYDPDVIYNRIEYLAQGLDVKVVILDHLSILLSGLDGDERRMLDVTMTRLRSLVERTGIAMFLVSHLRRTSSDQNHEEGARVTLGQLRGSASIAQLSDAVIALERNQQQGTSNTTVRVLKNRFTGEVGPACELSFDLSTCQFTEHNVEAEFDATTDF
jgi:twinkle protein